MHPGRERLWARALRKANATTARIPLSRSEAAQGVTQAADTHPNPERMRVRLENNKQDRLDPVRRAASRLLCVAIAIPPVATLTGWVPNSTEPTSEVAPLVAEAAPAGGTHGVVMAAWREHLLAYERAKLTAELAARFDIGLDLADRIHGAAIAEAIDPYLAFSLVMTESSFRTRAVSPVGAVGLTQLLPSTADWLVPGTRVRDLFDPDTNLRVGFRYLRQLIDRYGGDERLALIAYNRGPGTVNRLLRRGYDPDNGYAARVLSRSADLASQPIGLGFIQRRG